jgi:predicted transcriptional regulator
VQQKNESIEAFSLRTDKLAEFHRCSLRELAKILGISQGTLFTARTGAIPPSLKTWSKIEAAEIEAGIECSKISLRESEPTYQTANPKPPTIEDRLERLERGMEAILRILSEDRNPKPEPLPKPGKTYQYPKGSE